MGDAAGAAQQTLNERLKSRSWLVALNRCRKSALGDTIDKPSARLPANPAPSANAKKSVALNVSDILMRLQLGESQVSRTLSSKGDGVEVKIKGAGQVACSAGNSGPSTLVRGIRNGLHQKRRLAPNTQKEDSHHLPVQCREPRFRSTRLGWPSSKAKWVEVKIEGLGGRSMKRKTLARFGVYISIVLCCFMLRTGAIASAGPAAAPAAPAPVLSLEDAVVNAATALFTNGQLPPGMRKSMLSSILMTDTAGLNDRPISSRSALRNSSKRSSPFPILLHQRGAGEVADRIRRNTESDQRCDCNQGASRRILDLSQARGSSNPTRSVRGAARAKIDEVDVLRPLTFAENRVWADDAATAAYIEDLSGDKGGLFLIPLCGAD